MHTHAHTHKHTPDADCIKVAMVACFCLFDTTPWYERFSPDTKRMRRKNCLPGSTVNIQTPRDSPSQGLYIVYFGVFFALVACMYLLHLLPRPSYLLPISNEDAKSTLSIGWRWAHGAPHHVIGVLQQKKVIFEESKLCAKQRFKILACSSCALTFLGHDYHNLAC